MAKKKKSVVRCFWWNEPQPPMAEDIELAWRWLLDHNCAYAAFWSEHQRLLREHSGDDSQAWRYFPTAELLVRRPSIEVAARPWLYPWRGMSDTGADVLKDKGMIPRSSTMSSKCSWLRKVLSRCKDIQTAFLRLATMAKKDLRSGRRVSHNGSGSSKPSGRSHGNRELQVMWAMSLVTTRN